MGLIWEKIIRPAMFGLNAETAHELGIKSMRLGLASVFGGNADFGFGEIERFGLKFANPIGIAAGFDKNGVVVNQLATLGFGFVEVGTVTFEPQPGNPKPRLFRLPKDGALINRLGFNNDGAAIVAARIKKLDRKCIVGVNIGKNKNVVNEEATENYLKSFVLVHPVADYIAVNISSPNTVNLRELQKGDSFEKLVEALTYKNAELGRKPLLIKIAPDLSEAEIENIIDISLNYRVAGVIATNTTISRERLLTGNIKSFGAGGLSGRPLTLRSNEVIKKIYTYSNGTMPIIGVGGVFNAEDAFEKIACGASLIQAYTGLVYGGLTFVRDINYGLAALLKERGFAHIDQAIGSAALQ